ncbi:MBL fold metallo-hydrolase [bacterium]|nr:MBL fold metallo-hydrolase [bacterium]
MRHVSVAVIGVIIMMLSVAVHVQAQIGGAISPRVEVKQLNDHLYQLTATEFFPVVMIASIGPDGILLVDTGFKQTEELVLKELRKLGPGKIVYVINSHEHSDHTGGNELLGTGATIIAHERVKDQLQSGDNVLRELPPEALPNRGINTEITLQFNGEQVRIIPVPGGHTDTDMVVYFVKSRIVYLGGLADGHHFPFVDRAKGGSYSEYPHIIKQLLGIFPDDITIIPGHGSAFGISELKNFFQVLVETGEAVQKALQSGQDLAAMKKENILGPWSSYGQDFVKTDAWLQIIYDEMTHSVPQQKQSVIEAIYGVYHDHNSIQAALDTYQKLKKEAAKEYAFNEGVLNTFGYFLLNKKKTDDALTIFNANMQEYPASYNVYDSLAEAYLIKGEYDQAETYYKKALVINPQFDNAQKMLEKIEQLKKKEK